MFSYVSAMRALSFSYGSPMPLLFSFLLRKAMRTEDNHWISIVFAWSGLVSSVFPWCSEFRLIFIRVPIILRVVFWFSPMFPMIVVFALGSRVPALHLLWEFEVSLGLA